MSTAWGYFPDIKRERDKSMAMSKLDRIREIHTPIVPPKGMSLMFSTPGTQYCAGCEVDDPFYAVEWPCDTRRICDEEIDESADEGACCTDTDRGTD